jgi:hypothetical protein
MNRANPPGRRARLGTGRLLSMRSTRDPGFRPSHGSHGTHGPRRSKWVRVRLGRPPEAYCPGFADGCHGPTGTGRAGRSAGLSGLRPAQARPLAAGECVPGGNAGRGTGTHGDAEPQTGYTSRTARRCARRLILGVCYGTCSWRGCACSSAQDRLHRSVAVDARCEEFLGLGDPTPPNAGVCDGVQVPCQPIHSLSQVRHCDTSGFFPSALAKPAPHRLTATSGPGSMALRVPCPFHSGGSYARVTFCFAPAVVVLGAGGWFRPR